MSWWDDYLSAWNRHDAAAVGSFFAVDGVRVGAGISRNEGREAVVEYVRQFSDLFSTDHKVKTLVFLQNGDRFAAEWEWVGTHDRGGSRFGPATGRRWDIHGASVGRLKDEKIILIQEFWDTHGFLVQIGLA
jgi:uncharacterized protein (TIGR02246 family)